MALIKTASIISDIRGKIQGTVFQRSAGGLTVRSQTTPINKNSNRQNKTRNFINILQQQWRLLSPTERQTWLQFTNFNPIQQKRNSELFINGQQAFIKLNLYRLEYGFAIITTPQFSKCEITPVDVTIQLAGPNLFIKVDRELQSSFEFLIFFITVNLVPTINNPGSRFKLIKFTTTDSDTFNINNEYITIFGALPVSGSKVFFKFTNADKNSGLLFPFKTKSVIL